MGSEMCIRDRLTRGVKAVRILLTTIEAKRSEWEGQDSCAERLNCCWAGAWPSLGHSQHPNLCSEPRSRHVRGVVPALVSFVHIPSGSLDLAWPASAREPPTKSAKTPSTSTRGRTDQAQPEQMTKDEKQQPPRSEKNDMTQEARYD